MIAIADTDTDAYISTRRQTHNERPGPCPCGSLPKTATVVGRMSRKLRRRPAPWSLDDDEKGASIGGVFAALGRIDQVPRPSRADADQNGRRMRDLARTRGDAG